MGDRNDDKDQEPKKRVGFFEVLKNISRGSDLFIPLLLLILLLPLGTLFVDKDFLASTEKLSSVVANAAGSNWGSVTAFVFACLTMVAMGVLRAFGEGQEITSQERRIEAATRSAIENPEKPQLAWDAGRATLEKYLNRNLSQVRTIAGITYTVMLLGFVLIIYGLYEAFGDPGKLSVSIVAAASGVLMNFIGGSFLLVYRSLLAQSREYLYVLERINGVGMAVAVIESISVEDAALKNATTAELAKNLLTLYGASKAG